MILLSTKTSKALFQFDFSHALVRFDLESLSGTAAAAVGTPDPLTVSMAVALNKLTLEVE